jgi:hypothetical protein
LLFEGTKRNNNLIFSNYFIYDKDNNVINEIVIEYGEVSYYSEINTINTYKNNLKIKSTISRLNSDKNGIDNPGVRKEIKFEYTFY